MLHSKKNTIERQSGLPNRRFSIAGGAEVNNNLPGPSIGLQYAGLPLTDFVFSVGDNSPLMCQDGAR